MFLVHNLPPFQSGFAFVPPPQARKDIKALLFGEILNLKVIKNDLTREWAETCISRPVTPYFEKAIIDRPPSGPLNLLAIGPAF